MTTSNYYSISDGPGRFDLMLSLFEEGKTIHFSIFRRDFFRLLKVQVDSIHAKDRERKGWIIEGKIIASNKKFKAKSFKADFDSRMRKGKMETP